MYITALHNLATSKLDKVTYYQKVRVLSSYLEVCELIDVHPDILYTVNDVDDITTEEIKLLQQKLIGYPFEIFYLSSLGFLTKHFYKEI